MRSSISDRSAEIGLRSKGTHVALTMILLILFGASVTSAETPMAVEFIKFDNGMNVAIDLPGLQDALAKGADPNWIDRQHKRHETTLSHFVMLCSIARNVESEAPCLGSLKLLASAGAKLQPLDMGILFFPVADGKTQLVKFLLDMGADAAKWPNQEIGTPLSPVEYAVKNGHQSVVELLIAHGASKPNSEDAVQWRFVEVARHGSPHLLQELLESGARVNTKGRDGEVALINAVEDADLCRSYKKAVVLLNAGADPNIHGKSMLAFVTTPLHQAVWHSSFAYVRKDNPLCSEMLLSELVQKGAHVSALDSEGRTPLHIATEQNHLFAAQLLLQEGAKVMPRDKEGKTPLDLATSGAMIKLLKIHGATER